jgi:hypothetical protein
MTRNQRTIRKIFFVVILSFAPPLYLYSQVTGGTGADSSGTVIPNAQMGSNWCCWLVDLNHNYGTGDSVRAKVDLVVRS